MKQLVQMIIFDIKMNFKNFMGAYMIIFPALILAILRFFIPTVESTALTFAVVNQGKNAVEEWVIEDLSSIGEILYYPSIADMKLKLRDIGYVEGLYHDHSSGNYVSLLESTGEDNKVFSFAARFIRQAAYKRANPDAARLTEFSYQIPEELSDRTKTSPVATTGAASFILFISMLASFLIGLSIVNDKDFGTVLAIRVSPVSKADYFIGRSVFPLLIVLFYACASLLVLGLMHVNLLQVFTVVVSSFALTLVYGLLIGAVGKNEVEAMGFGKAVSIILILGVLGATLLPAEWHWTVWWSPVYWLFDALDAVFTETADWYLVLINSGLSIAISLIYFMILRNKILRGLS